MKGIARVIMVACLLFAVAGCSSSGSDKKKAEQVKSEEELYTQALDKLEKGSYNGSIELFQDLERTYPYSKWATKAKIMSAYASYQDEEYDDALLTLERFIKLHPGNKNVPYAYYLRALCYYDQISDVKRDQSYTEFARDSLKELIARFPDSEYARDARIKLDLVYDHLAGKEVHIGRFYLRRGNHIGAINRFQNVLEKYETTTHTPEALHRLVEAYTQLGVMGEATKYAAVLGHNFPGSRWYGYSYDLLKEGGITLPEKSSNKGWFSGLFGGDNEVEKIVPGTSSSPEIPDLKD